MIGRSNGQMMRGIPRDLTTDGFKVITKAHGWEVPVFTDVDTSHRYWLLLVISPSVYRLGYSAILDLKESKIMISCMDPWNASNEILIESITVDSVNHTVAVPYYSEHALIYQLAKLV